MIIIAQISYPPESNQEMAKRFLEAPQIPDFLNRKGPYVCSSMSTGVTAVSLYELDKSKVGEGYEFVNNYYTTYFSVPGFKYEAKVFLDIGEGLKMIGMG